LTLDVWRKAYEIIEKKAPPAQPQLAKKVKCPHCPQELSAEEYSRHIEEHMRKKREIEALISTVQRPELQESLRQKYLPRVFEPSVTRQAVETDIKIGLGIPMGPKLFEEWERMEKKVWGVRKDYMDKSLLTTWRSDDRRFIQLTMWMDFGVKVPALVRQDFPESRFRSFTEADQYAKEHGGYCSGIVEIAGKRYWLLYVKEMR